MCKGNDVQNHNYVALLSGPYVSAGALSVVPENFDKAMVVHAVRKNVKKNWLNDRDQFLHARNKIQAQLRAAMHRVESLRRFQPTPLLCGTWLTKEKSFKSSTTFSRSKFPS